MKQAGQLNTLDRPEVAETYLIDKDACLFYSLYPKLLRSTVGNSPLALNPFSVNYWSHLVGKSHAHWNQ
jgi:hypothetical protein